MSGNNGIVGALSSTKIDSLEKIAQGITVNSESSFPVAFAHEIVRQKILAHVDELQFFAPLDGSLVRVDEFCSDLCEQVPFEHWDTPGVVVDIPFMFEFQDSKYLVEVTPGAVVEKANASHAEKYVKAQKRRLDIVSKGVGGKEVEILNFMPYSMNSGKMMTRIKSALPMTYIDMRYDSRALDSYVKSATIEYSGASAHEALKKVMDAHKRFGSSRDFYGERLGVDFMTNGPKYRVEKKRKK